LLDQCQQELSGFRNDNTYMRNCVIEFDSVLHLKANKLDLTQIVQWVNTDFVSVKTVTSNAFLELKDQLTVQSVRLQT
jgi:hypothetical protein